MTSPAVAQTKTEPAAAGRLQSLDGLRAISILLVLFGHLNGTRHFPPYRSWFGDLAHLGVVVFFVISGFLITNLLRLEEARRGRVSLRLFYARRALRIFPASLAYLAVVAVLGVLGTIRLHPGDMLHAVTYTVNYFPSRSWYVGHLWSLSVEEQFYLLWPFAFVLSSPAARPRIAAAVVLLGPVARAAAALLLRGSPYRDMEMFPMVADCLAAGCLLACLREWLERQPWYLALFRPRWSLLLLAVVFLINRYTVYSIVGVPGIGLINVLLAILIHRSAYLWNDRLGVILNCRPLAFCGLLSYSLYLWQQLFLNRASTAWPQMFPWNILFSAAAALLSYFLLERPLLQLRHRLRGA